MKTTKGGERQRDREDCFRVRPLENNGNVSNFLKVLKSMWVLFYLLS